MTQATTSNKSLNTPVADRFYQAPAADVLQQVRSTPSGLSSAEAQRRLSEFGPNELVERGGRSRWQILAAQFTNVLTLILIAAAILSFFLGDELEAVVIFAIVVLNGILGYTQEHRAEQAMAALKRMSVPTVRVRRDGKVQEISAREVVQGDVIILETGNVVSADGRLLQTLNLRLTEAALTGESEAVEKDADLVFGEERPLGDRLNMVYAGTVVSYGRGEMVVTGTGMGTELGKIADLLQSVEQEQTPLQQRLDRLGRTLAIAAIVLIVVIFAGGVALGQEWQTMLLTSVSLAVAAIPEALTAVVTIALSLGAQRMLKRRALIRQLPAVETLGSVTVICSDKTGTLTQNRMTVTALDIANHRLDLQQRREEGQMSLQPLGEHTLHQDLLPTLDLLLISGALCNDAMLAGHRESGEHMHAVGDPTEGALVIAAAEYGIFKDELDAAFVRVGELPFDSVRKRMTTIHRLPESDAEVPESLLPVWQRRIQANLAVNHIAFTKGAIDSLLTCTRDVWVQGERVPLDAEWQKRLMESHDSLAQKGMRVLAVAVRPLNEAPTKEQVINIEQDLILVGMFGMIDPPRPEVREAVLTCRNAGIRPVMITGDHPLTARHIAQQVGITEGDAPFLTGQELDKLSDEELRKKTEVVQVFARVSPEHKLKLIQAYQDRQHVVAMTGDGVNDAPALKKADIGVAMGITGTDVSKEAANMVLLDDNFATIVAAVEEGRVVYDNIRKFIKYLLSCNASEIAVMLLWPITAMLAGLQLTSEAALALLPLQILWMNLVTDGLPALALSVEKAERNVMNRPPYSSQASIFQAGMGAFIIVMGVVMSVIAISIGLLGYWLEDPAWRTLLFTTLIFNQIVLAVSVRSDEQSIFSLGLFSNRSMVLAVASTVLLQLLVIYVPFLQEIFGTQALGLRDLLIIAAASLLVLLAVEIWKWRLRRRTRLSR